MAMTERQIREAASGLERVQKLVELKREISTRDVDFCVDDQRRPLGRRQLDLSKIEKLQEHLKFCAMKWFENLIAEEKRRLVDLGVMFEEHDVREYAIEEETS